MERVDALCNLTDTEIVFYRLCHVPYCIWTLKVTQCSVSPTKL